MHIRNSFVLFARAIARACSLSAATVLLVGSFANQARAAGWVSFPGSVREVPAVQPGVAMAGPVIVRSELRVEETAAPITFEIALRMRNFPEFQARVTQGERIAAAEIAREYSPFAADEDRVIAWIRSQGLVVTRTDPNHLAVFGRGSIAAVQQAFRTRFARVAAHGAEYTSAVAPLSLPAEVAAPVLGIHGLQPHIRPHFLMKPGMIHLGANLSGGPPYYPSQIETAYNAAGVGTGSGQTIAVCEWAYPAPTDLSTFWSTAEVSQSTTNVTQIDINGGPGNSPDSGFIQEASLDVEWAGALAPSAQIRVYGSNVNDLTGFDQTSQQILADISAYPSLHQFSISAGWNESEIESDYLVIEAQFMASLANAGVTVFAATGDGGSNPDPTTGKYTRSDPLDVFYPASDPSVVSVGGTSLQLNSNGSVLSETGWSGSGGGFSGYFTRPSWQAGVTGLGGTTRMLPDVAAAADPNYGAAVCINGKWMQIGGTSWATPTWAAFCAVINQVRASSSQTPLGLFNPRIYALIGSGSFPLRDITSGSNGAYQAGTGYDLVTGLGVPNVAALAQASLASSGAPIVVAQLGDRTTTVGQAATFALAADGVSPLLYQWQREPNGTSTWANLTDDGIYRGSSSADLVVNNATAAMSGDTFQCVVSNRAGDATSVPETLTVNYTGVTTFAGWPEAYGWVDATGSAARFGFVDSVRTDSAGNIYVGDGSNTVRKITPTGVVTTVAGIANVTGSQDGPAASATFNDIGGVAVDSSGTIYVADSGNYTIRKITTSGVVSTLAGYAGLQASVDGTGSAARFYDPENLAVDAAGDIWVADGQGDTIREVTPAGVVATFAGEAGTPGFANGNGTAAQFNNVLGIAVDASGNLYVGDGGNNAIRKITPAGVVTTLAGSASGRPGSADGTGSSARFDVPTGVAVDSSGNVFVADSGNATVREINPAGVVMTIAGQAGQYGSADGLATAASFQGPADVTIDPSGIVYVADQPNCTVRRIVLTAVSPPTITTQPSPQTVNSGGNASFTVGVGNSPSPSFQWQASTDGGATWTNLSDNATYSGSGTATLTVNSVSTAMNGDLFDCVLTNFAGTVISSPAILVVDTPLAVVTLAGLAVINGSADGSGTGARFALPSDVATDSAGDILVADTGNHIVRRITPAGVVTTLAGQAGISGSNDGSASASFNHPAGVAVDSPGNVYVADTDNNEIRKVTAGGVVSTLAGVAGASGSNDGKGTAASFDGPSGIVADKAGNLYVADTLNHTVRKVTSAGAVTTIAGVAGASGFVDGAGSAARFHGPQGLALDASNNLFVADTNNNAIRKIVTASGAVTTVAGQAGIAGNTDGANSQARFHYPSGLAVDATGNLYVVDTDNHTLREIASPGAVSTLAGLAGSSGSADGIGTAARFDFPTGVAVDSSGNVYVADTNNDTIRLAVSPAAPAITAQPQSQTTTAGSSVTFSVTATGKPAPAYQWDFDGAAISGATSSSLGLTNVQSADEGSYTVTVTNSAGSVTSSAATLTVNSSGSGGGGSSGGGGGGGGAPSVWFYGLLSLLALARRMLRRD